MVMKPALQNWYSDISGSYRFFLRICSIISSHFHGVLSLVFLLLNRSNTQDNASIFNQLLNIMNYPDDCLPSSQCDHFLAKIQAYRSDN